MVKLNHKIRLHAHFESREEVTFLTRKNAGFLKPLNLTPSLFKNLSKDCDLLSCFRRRFERLGRGGPDRPRLPHSTQEDFQC